MTLCIRHYILNRIIDGILNFERKVLLYVIVCAHNDRVKVLKFVLSELDVLLDLSLLTLIGYLSYYFILHDFDLLACPTITLLQKVKCKLLILHSSVNSIQILLNVLNLKFVISIQSLEINQIFVICSELFLYIHSNFSFKHEDLILHITVLLLLLYNTTGDVIIPFSNPPDLLSELLNSLIDSLNVMIDSHVNYLLLSIFLC
jgi:hypothetical protein